MICNAAAQPTPAPTMAASLASGSGLNQPQPGESEGFAQALADLSPATPASGATASIAGIAPEPASDPAACERQEFAALLPLAGKLVPLAAGPEGAPAPMDAERSSEAPATIDLAAALRLALAAPRMATDGEQGEPAAAARSHSTGEQDGTDGEDAPAPADGEALPAGSVAAISVALPSPAAAPERCIAAPSGQGLLPPAAPVQQGGSPVAATTGRGISPTETAPRDVAPGAVALADLTPIRTAPELPPVLRLKLAPAHDEPAAPLRTPEQSSLSPLDGAGAAMSIRTDLAPALALPGGTVAVANASQDFATLVDRLVAARDAAFTSGGESAVQVAMRHAEFGHVSLRFEQGGDGLSVAIASPDPEFARAAQAALPQSALAPAEHRSGSPHQVGTAGTATGQAGHHFGQASGNGQPGTGDPHRNNGGGRPARPGPTRPPATGSAPGLGGEPPRAGIYA